MLSDEQLGAQLRARLSDEVAEVGATPDLASTVRRRHTRRTLATRAGLAVPFVVAAVTAMVVATGGAGGRHAPPAAQTGASAAAPLRDVAYVTAQTDAALAKATDYVLETRLVPKAGYSDVERTDLATQKSRFDSYGPKGRLNSIAMSGPVTGSPTVLVVDYPDRAWWTYTMSPAPSGPAGAVSTVYLDPAQIRDAMNKSELKLLGEDQVNGHDTWRLQATNLPESLPVALDMWVDAQSYLPYRVTTTKAGNSSTVDYDWLPRTAENLVALDLTPPTGFTHYDKPIEQRGGHEVG